MKKIEIIWRELLFQAIEKGNRRFTQKDVAAKFGFSVSTVFAALTPLRKMGAVRVTGRDFTLEDSEKALYHWASVRNINKDLVFSGRVNLSALEIEGMAPPGSILGGFTAARSILGGAPADYDKVYFYANDLEPFKSRYETTSGNPNLFVLKEDDFMSQYGEMTTLAQTFVDLWNMNEWYAKEFTKALKEKIDELLP